MRRAFRAVGPAVTPAADSTAPVEPIRPEETRTTLACPADEAVFGQALELLVTVEGRPPIRGSVALRIAGRPDSVATSPVQDGRATLVLKDLAVGAHRLVAAFSGNRPASASEEVDLRVVPAATRFYGTLQPFHIVAGTPGEFTAFVEALEPSAAAPVGDVTFWQDGVKLGAAPLASLVGGGASAAVHLAPAGDGRVTVVARYEGGDGFLAATERTLTLEISKQGPNLDPVIPPELREGG